MKISVVQYTVLAQKDLRKLDRKTAQRVVLKVASYIEAEDPLSEAKHLSGALDGLFRYRVGDYRVIFELDVNGALTILTVLRIKHRKDIYR